MSGKRHRIWDFVVRDLESMKAHAPAGFEPVCRVYVGGRSEPLILGRVETRNDLPWVYLVSARKSDSDTDPGEGDRDDVMLFVRDEAIQLVELAFARAGKASIGFSHGTLGDTSAA